MPEICVNGQNVVVGDGVTVACAILQAGQTRFRTSVTGQPRGPLCGMGICFECRVTINGRAHERSCQVVVHEGMEIKT